MKTFDIDNFNKTKSSSEANYYVDDNTKVRVFEIGKENNKKYVETITRKNEKFQEYSVYYFNGKLKITGFQFANNFEKGVWKEYDEQGNLIKETDYDAPYKFTWEDVLKFIEKHDIDMNHEQFEILRGSDEKGSSWAIIFEKKGVYDKLSVINIDGRTGEITRETEIDYPADGEYESDFPEEDE